jgi:hypothetical protein
MTTQSIPTASPPRLPEDVQAAFIATMPGLEKARILQPGYAIEYDHVDPRELTPSLETKRSGDFSWPVRSTARRAMRRRLPRACLRGECGAYGRRADPVAWVGRCLYRGHDRRSDQPGRPSPIACSRRGLSSA